MYLISTLKADSLFNLSPYMRGIIIRPNMFITKKIERRALEEKGEEGAKDFRRNALNEMRK